MQYKILNFVRVRSINIVKIILNFLLFDNLNNFIYKDCTNHNILILTIHIG
jgi:hypothetical protein